MDRSLFTVILFQFDGNGFQCLFISHYFGANWYTKWISLQMSFMHEFITIHLSFTLSFTWQQWTYRKGLAKALGQQTASSICKHHFHSVFVNVWWLQIANGIWAWQRRTEHNRPKLNFDDFSVYWIVKSVEWWAAYALCAWYYVSINWLFLWITVPMVLVNHFVGKFYHIWAARQSTARIRNRRLIWSTDLMWVQNLHYTLWPLYGLWIPWWSFGNIHFIYAATKNQKKGKKDWSHHEEWTEEEKKNDLKLKTENRRKRCAQTLQS